MAKIDLEKEIRRAVDTGSVVFGQREVEKTLLLGSAKIIVVAKNMPNRLREKIMHDTKVAGAEVLEFGESGLKLGSLCGKPFNVSALAIKEAGKSNIMSIFKKK